MGKGAGSIHRPRRHTPRVGPTAIQMWLLEESNPNSARDDVDADAAAGLAGRSWATRDRVCRLDT